MLETKFLSSHRAAFRGACALAALVGVVALLAPTAHAQESLLGLNGDNRLFRFTAPAAPTSTISFTDLNGNVGLTTPVGNLRNSTGESIQCIDYRPSNNQLYALTFRLNFRTPELRLYTINTTTGAATLLSDLIAAPAEPGSGGSATARPYGAGKYSMDFDPQTDTLRIVDDQQGNYRVTAANLTTGILYSDQPLPLGYITGVAYTNNAPGATSTRLLAVESGAFRVPNDVLHEVSPPNSGALNAFANFGYISFQGELDISGVTGQAYYAGFDGAIYRFDSAAATPTSTRLGPLTGVGNLHGIAASVGIRSIGSATAPEPGALALLGTGVLAVGMMRRRMRK